MIVVFTSLQRETSASVAGGEKPCVHHSIYTQQRWRGHMFLRTGHQLRFTFLLPLKKKKKKKGLSICKVLFI